MAAIDKKARTTTTTNTTTTTTTTNNNTTTTASNNNTNTDTTTNNNTTTNTTTTTTTTTTPHEIMADERGHAPPPTHALPSLSPPRTPLTSASCTNTNTTATTTGATAATVTVTVKPTNHRTARRPISPSPSPSPSPPPPHSSYSSSSRQTHTHQHGGDDNDDKDTLHQRTTQEDGGGATTATTTTTTISPLPLISTEKQQQSHTQQPPVPLPTAKAPTRTTTFQFEDSTTTSSTSVSPLSTSTTTCCPTLVHRQHHQHHQHHPQSQHHRNSNSNNNSDTKTTLVRDSRDLNPNPNPIPNANANGFQTAATTTDVTSQPNESSTRSTCGSGLAASRRLEPEVFVTSAASSEQPREFTESLTTTTTTTAAATTPLWVKPAPNHHDHRHHEPREVRTQSVPPTSSSSSSSSSNPAARNTGCDRREIVDGVKCRNINEVSLSDSSSILSSIPDRTAYLPYPRSSSPRLVRRQNHVEVPCDDVAVIDIENGDDVTNPSAALTKLGRREPGAKSSSSSFYIGDEDTNLAQGFNEDISVITSDLEITESSLALPDHFLDHAFREDNVSGDSPTPTCADSSLQSSLADVPSTRGSFSFVNKLKKQHRKNKKESKNRSAATASSEKKGGGGGSAGGGEGGEVEKGGGGGGQEKKDKDDDRSKNGKVSSSRRSGGKKGQGSNNTPTSSNWRRLRNTLKAANEMKSPKKATAPLTREDSFLRKFSTRNHNNVHHNSSALTDDDTSASDNQVTNAVHHPWTKFVIQHDGNFMFYWLGVVTLAALYNLWTCIAREGFREIQTGCPPCWYGFDGFFDVIYVLDIVVQFRTGYLDQGLMVYDSKKLRQKYFNSRVIYVDFACLLPLDFAQLVVGVHPMLRFPRFLKTYRAFHFLHMCESRTAYPNFIRVVNLTHILFLGAHWFAAFYYMISEAEGFKGGWAYPPPVGNLADVRRKYLKSLYWSTLTLTTIGDLPQPENSNQARMSNAAYVFVIVSYLIGVFVFATIVGQVGNVINNRNASRQEFERLLDGAKVYMQTHSVPQNLQKRVQRWYDYVWSRGRLNNGDINSLGLLPDKLKTELAIHVNLETLKKVTIFQECQPEFLHDLVLKMKAYIFTPGDLICRRGEVAREMFIIADGLVEIISETGTILKRMGAGDFFGEIGILNLDGGINRRSADVRSVGYLELFVLSRDDILGALKDHPEAESIIRDYGQRRLREVEAHRKRVKPLKCQEVAIDAPTGAHSVQNRLLMTLRSLSPAVRRESSQLGNTGRQSSLQNPPTPGSPGPNSKRRTSSLDERLLSADEKFTRQSSSCRSDSLSHDGSGGKRGRSKAMSIMQTPTHDLAFQHLADQISSMQDMIDRRLTVLEESYESTSVRLERLATSHEVLIRMFKRVVHERSAAPPTSRTAEIHCEDINELHPSCV